ncbi:MAG: SHOCT domain-containing protein, partial [Chitinophagaceae bacterium]
EEAVIIPEIAAVEVSVEDEIEQKLIKLKTLYDKQLITREEYEHKKAAILDSM